MPENELQEKPVARNAKERLYDKIKVPVWVLDVIIAVCAVGIVVSLYLGMK